MPWDEKFWTPIILKDGRRIESLSEARELMLSLPTLRRNSVMWQYTAELLKEAAADNTHLPHVDAETQLLLALKAEGLI